MKWGLSRRGRLVAVLIALTLLVVLAVCFPRREARRVWKVGDDVEVVISYARNRTFDRAPPSIEIRKGHNVVLKRTRLPVRQRLEEHIYEKDSAENLMVVKGDNSVIGVLHSSLILSVHPEKAKTPSDSWTSLVVERTVRFVVDIDTGKRWNADRSGRFANSDSLLKQFIQEYKKCESTKILAPIIEITVLGESVEPDFIRSLGVFPNLEWLGFDEAELNPEVIGAIASLENVRKLSLRYVKFDAELLDSCTQLKNIEVLVVDRGNLASISDGEEPIEKLRKGLPETKVVVKGDYD